MRGKEQRRVTKSAGTELPARLAKRVAAYALAAGGAGLVITAGAQPADARIVYTPAHIVFSCPFSPVFLDIDRDGTNDFRMSSYCFSSFHSKRVAGAPGNGVRESSRRGFAARLARGARIDPGEDFRRGGNVRMEYVYSAGGFSSGPWRGNASGFLGLEFQIDGQAHYGWAEVQMTGSSFGGVVKGYAYNTVPNQPILAGQTSDAGLIGERPPQPATLGLLASGAPALDIWRSRKRDLLQHKGTSEA